MKKPLISIITVVKERAYIVEECIKSILGQSFTNFEYLIKEGNSTDNTAQVISKYKNQLTYFESSPDKGLYNAMNIATMHTHGDWVCYIQSDDQLFDAKVLEKVAPYLEKTTADVIYGAALITLDWGITRTINAKPISTVWNHQPYSHQAMFLRTTVAKKYPFNLTYRSAADYDQIYKLYTLGYQFEAIPVMVARCLGGGLSDHKRIASLTEAGIIKRSYDQNRWHRFLHILYATKSAINLKLRHLLPVPLIRKFFELRSKYIER